MQILPLTHKLKISMFRMSFIWTFFKFTGMLFKLTSVRLLSFFWILDRVSSTLVVFGGSSGKTLNSSGFTTPKITNTQLCIYCTVRNKQTNRQFDQFHCAHKSVFTHCWCLLCLQSSLLPRGHHNTACCSSVCTFPKWLQKRQHTLEWINEGDLLADWD